MIHIIWGYEWGRIGEILMVNICTSCGKEIQSDNKEKLCETCKRKDKKRRLREKILLDNAGEYSGNRFVFGRY